MRVAIGIQPEHTPIVYTMEKDDLCSYIMYTGCMTEQEGLEILNAAEESDYKKACYLFHKYFRGEDSDKVFVEADESWPISEAVHDDWFDECRQVMSMMRINRIRTVLTYERDEEVW